MSCGVHEIFNSVSGKIYIGSSIDVENRLRVHKRKLVRGSHINNHLQNAWNKYGVAAFHFFQIEECKPPELLEKEQFWMDACRAYSGSRGYNICPVAGNCLGRKLTAESRRKISESHKGKVLSDEHKQKLSVAGTGHVVANETREKIGNAHRGKAVSEKTRAAISANLMGNVPWNKGKSGVYSEECLR